MSKRYSVTILHEARIRLQAEKHDRQVKKAMRVLRWQQRLIRWGLIR